MIHAVFLQEPAGEVDPVALRPALDEGRDPDPDDQRREHVTQPALADEIDPRLANQLRHRQPVQPPQTQQDVKDHPRDKDGREHAGDDAGGQGGGVAADGACAEPVEERRRDDRGHVGIEDGGERFVIARGDGGA